MKTDSTGKLIALSGNLESPGDASGSDWPNVGASGPAGEESGAGEVIEQTENQGSPRRTQDSGDNTPSVWGSDGGFVVAKNKGEGGGNSTDVKCDWSVDLDSGQTIPNAAEKY